MQYVQWLAVKFNFKLTGGQREKEREREREREKEREEGKEEKSARCPPAFEQLITDPV